jgi:hypothetical protein
MFHSTLSRFGLAAMLAVCSYAVWRGRRPERWAAIALALAWVASEALEDFNLAHTAQPMVFAIDVAYDGLLFWLLLGTRREWVLWAFAYQSFVVLTHLAAILDPYADRWTFFTAYLVWSYLELAALAIGVAVEGRRARAWTLRRGSRRRARRPESPEALLMRSHPFRAAPQPKG